MKSAIMLLIGGICAAAGIVLAATGGFGAPGGDVALVFSQLGYDGVDNLEVTSRGVTAIVLFLAGVGFMAGANATAWKETGGY